MFDDYKKEVIFAYKSKLSAEALSLNLVNLTPSKLKTECLHVYLERYNAKKDDYILRAFFGPNDNGKDYSQIIRSCDVDKFRPLINLLRKNTNGSDPKNFELLAWLIDFNPRPSTLWESENVKGSNDAVKQTEVENTSSASIIQVHNIDLTSDNGLDSEKDKATNDKIEQKEIHEAEARINGLKKPRSISSIKKSILAFIAAIAVCGGTYLISKNSDQGCMYWTGDRYQPIACDEKAGDAVIIALDTFKVAHAKKINRPDTLTKNSIRKVWYAKINKQQIEFYTDSIAHPVDNRKRLLPMTEYILSKYVLRK